MTADLEALVAVGTLANLKGRDASRDATREDTRRAGHSGSRSACSRSRSGILLNTWPGLYRSRRCSVFSSNRLSFSRCTLLRLQDFKWRSRPACCTVRTGPVLDVGCASALASQLQRALRSMMREPVRPARTRRPNALH